MALGPKDMGAAMLQNLPKKTGKTLEEWLELCTQSGLSNKKELQQQLKEQGLGHFQAQLVAQIFLGEKSIYDNPAALEEALFPKPAQQALYQALKTQLEQLEGVKAQPCKTYIPFYKHLQFAALYPAQEGGIYLGLSLPPDFESPAFSPAAGATPTRITQHTLLQAPSLSLSLQEALQLALQNS